MYNTQAIDSKTLQVLMVLLLLRILKPTKLCKPTLHDKEAHYCTKPVMNETKPFILFIYPTPQSEYLQVLLEIVRHCPASTGNFYLTNSMPNVTF